MTLETGCGIKALACGILWVVSRHSATVNIVNAFLVMIGDDSSLSIKTFKSQTAFVDRSRICS